MRRLKSASRKFNKMNVEEFVADLKNAPWPDLKNFDDINDAWGAWKNVFLSVIDKHAPIRTMRVRNIPSQWLNPELQREMFK